MTFRLLSYRHKALTLPRFPSYPQTLPGLTLRLSGKLSRLLLGLLLVSTLTADSRRISASSTGLLLRGPLRSIIGPPEGGGVSPADRRTSLLASSSRSKLNCRRRGDGRADWLMLILWTGTLYTGRFPLVIRRGRFLIKGFGGGGNGLSYPRGNLAVPGKALAAIGLKTSPLLRADSVNSGTVAE